MTAPSLARKKLRASRQGRRPPPPLPTGTQIADRLRAYREAYAAGLLKRLKPQILTPRVMQDIGVLSVFKPVLRRAITLEAIDPGGRSATAVRDDLIEVLVTRMHDLHRIGRPEIELLNLLNELVAVQTAWPHRWPAPPR